MLEAIVCRLISNSLESQLRTLTQENIWVKKLEHLEPGRWN